VKLGRLEDARGRLERLRALNAPEAVELAKASSDAYAGQPGAVAPARR